LHQARRENRKTIAVDGVRERSRRQRRRFESPPGRSLAIKRSSLARLGDMLLEEKLCTPAQLEEALETQVVHGGRLGTNLCELGFLKEPDLARMLGKQFGIAFASGDMQPD